LEVDAGSRKVPADVLQRFHEAGDYKGVDVCKSCGGPKAVEIIEQQADDTFEL